MPKLTIKYQDVLIKEIDLETKPTWTVGRTDDNDIWIDHMAVSSHHARIDNNDGYFILSDLKSTNGTFINGKKIAGPTTLKLNDWISIGKHIIYFK